MFGLFAYTLTLIIIFAFSPFDTIQAIGYVAIYTIGIIEGNNMRNRRNKQQYRPPSTNILNKGNK